MDTFDQTIVESFYICAGFIFYSFVWSIIGKNWSKVDQIWSITPIVYCWHFWYCSSDQGSPAVDTTYGNVRVLLIAILVTLWGMRLTYNFYRRGGYGDLIRHEEDYRWEHVRRIVPPILHTAFNFGFVAAYQNLLLWLLTLPVYASLYGPADLNTVDIILCVVFLFLLLMETIADQQQWSFHCLKHSLSAEQRSVHSDRSVREGFLQRGLFAVCRHPAYFAEQFMWICVYLFSLRAHAQTGKWSVANWTGTGAALLVLLFAGSMAFAESITRAKYPAYERYQRRVSQCIPWFPRDRLENDGKKNS